MFIASCDMGISIPEQKKKILRVLVRDNKKKKNSRFKRLLLIKQTSRETTLMKKMAETSFGNVINIAVD